MNQEDKIKAYLLNQLPPEAANAFKQEILADPNLKAKVKGMKLMLLMQKAAEKDRNRAKMEEWGGELPPISDASKGFWRRYGWLAAGGLLVVSVVALSKKYRSAAPSPTPSVPTISIDTMKTTPQTNDIQPPIASVKPSTPIKQTSLFHDTNEEITAELARMRKEETTSGFSASGLDQYIQKRQFKTAISEAYKLPEKSDETNLKIAFCHLQLKNYKEAIVICDALLKNENIFFHTQNNARWIKAQSCFAQHNGEEAQKMLDLILKSRSFRGNPPSEELILKVTKLNENILNRTQK